MTSRVLPPVEYPRLAETYLAPLQHAFPDGTRVVVVEDGPQIVATWALVLFPHVEGVWTHPDYRKNPAVVRRLLATMFREARDAGYARVFTAAESDDVREILRRLGAEHLPGDHYVLPLQMEGR